ncbi:MAG: hypothetical protein WC346_21245 [Methanogenium sp.]|jgi:hypothetical protein
MKIVRVDKYEFETSDGQVFEHPISLEEIPTLEEFQKIHNSCYQHLSDLLSEAIDERDGESK